MDGKILTQNYQSPCGELILGEYGGKLCLCNWTDELHPGRVERRLRATLKAEMAEGTGEAIGEAAAQLDQYFGGTRTAFHIPLLFAGTPFQQKVWRGLLDVPYGATIPYGTLARRLGQPTAARAVAAAVGANAMSIVVPCHRIVGADGSLTGFGGGMAAKRFLLELENRNRSRMSQTDAK